MNQMNLAVQKSAERGYTKLSCGAVRKGNLVHVSFLLQFDEGGGQFVKTKTFILILE